MIIISLVYWYFTFYWFITISNLNDHREDRESWKCKQFHKSFPGSLLDQSANSICFDWWFVTDVNPSYLDVAFWRLDGVDDVLPELLPVQPGYPVLHHILCADTVITCTEQLSIHCLFNIHKQNWNAKYNRKSVSGLVWNKFSSVM